MQAALVATRIASQMVEGAVMFRSKRGCRCVGMQLCMQLV